MVLGIWGVLLLLPCICCSACLEEERISLLDFKQGLNFTYYREYNYSTPLQSWRGFNCCAWEGVGCHPHTAHVLTLDLVDIEWSEIRGGLFQLLHLEHLDLKWNFFRDLSIPPQVGALRRLKYLSFFGCGFAGQIPRELTKLQQLELLDLSGNGLDGVIPRELSKLQQLKYLKLEYNNLHGVIPRELSKLQQLEYLSLGDNNLHGAIPKEIGNMSSLKFLRLSYNNDLQSNKLEDWITHLRGLEQLRLGYVNFSMAGDSWVGNIASLTNLTALYMYGCGLLGEIPPSFANLSRLQELRLSENSLRGKIPACLGALPLSYLDLGSNKLNGSIPSTLGNLSALRHLEMQDNSFSGPIPISFAKLSKLEELNLGKNSLNGTFSFFTLNNCTKLTDLDLSSNTLTVKLSTSTIPKFQLEHLGLSQCNIRENFPAFISTQYFIDYLNLSNNFLSGYIPNWIWEITSLRFLSLVRNNFTGSISNIFKLNYLEILDLSNNKLSGGIP